MKFSSRPRARAPECACGLLPTQNPRVPSSGHAALSFQVSLAWLPALPSCWPASAGPAMLLELLLQPVACGRGLRPRGNNGPSAPCQGKRREQKTAQSSTRTVRGVPWSTFLFLKHERHEKAAVRSSLLSHTALSGGNGRYIIMPVL